MNDTSPKRGGWGLRLTTGLVFAYLYAPILILVVFSFNSSKLNAVWKGFTWEWYVKALHDAAMVEALRTSLYVAGATTIISTVLGTAAALVLGRHAFRGRAAVESMFSLPIIIPEIVVAFSMVVFFGFVGFRLGTASVVVAHVAFSLSYVVFVVRSRLAGMNRTLEEAAADLGADPFTTFRRVTLPLLAPGILSAALLVFTISLDDYIITSFVAGQGATTLPVLIYSLVKTGITPEINAVSTVLLAVTFVLVLASRALTAERIPRSAVVGLGVVLASLVAFAVFGGGRADARPTLNLYIWSNYTSEKLIRTFEDRYRVKVNIETYDSNEAMLAKLQTGLAEYDVVVPSDYMVGILVRENLIRPLDRDVLTNFGNLDEFFLNRSFDPENRHSVPYTWGTTGIGYRKDKISGKVEGWDAMWDPAHKNRIAMLDDMREAFAAALKRRGRSLNSTDESDIAEAARQLSAQKNLVKAYDSATFAQLLLSGDAWIVQGYNGQIAKAARENPNIVYVVPREGCTLAVDNLVIPKNAPHPELAHLFINYVLEPEASAEIMNATGYATPNKAAKALLGPDRVNDATIFPPQSVLERCEFLEDLGPVVTKYDAQWTRIKSE